MRSGPSTQARLGPGGPELRAGQRLLLLEVSLFTCSDNATLPTPDCEQQALSLQLEGVAGAAAKRQAWEAAGKAGLLCCNLQLLSWDHSTPGCDWGMVLLRPSVCCSTALIARC